LIRFILNEKTIETDLPPGRVILDFIRYHQHLMGTKIGCREGDCGACTVLVGSLLNDELVYQSMTSCLMPLANANGKHVVTIEGINFPGQLNPIQQAMADEGATQCGFCTPGFVVSLAGYCLQKESKDPIASIDGNICRCTGYKSIERAATTVETLMKKRNGEDPAVFVTNKKILPAYFSEIKQKLKSLPIAEIQLRTPNSELQTPVTGGTDLYVQKHEDMVHGSNSFVFDQPTLNGQQDNFQEPQTEQPPLPVAADIYRPAAIDQLTVLGGQIGVDVYSERENKNAVEIAQNAIKEAKAKNKNVVIIDTAGRLAIDEVMMTEVANIKKAVAPNEILFVVDAMTGQDAVNTAKAFNDRLDFSGVVLTKLDGDTRGGAALSIQYTVNKPIKFTSAGEKMETLDVFYPDRMAQRILGMGDITSLVEKAQEQYDEEQAKRLEKKIRKNQFDFQDFLDQLQQIKKMGNLKDLMAMIPGVGKAMKDIDISDDAFKGVEAIIKSMTPFERNNPDEINGSRRLRIAKGCGKDIADVNAFMKQFEQMRQMMQSMNKMPMGRMMMPGMRR